MHSSSRYVTASQCGTILIGLMFGLTQLGCEPPPRPPVKTAPTERQRSDSSANPPQSSINEGDTLLSDVLLAYNIDVPRDYWDAYYLQGKHIGYSHLRIEETGKANELKYTITEKLQYSQGAQSFDSELIQTCIETNSGKLKSFNAVFTQGDKRSTATGTVRGNEVQIKTDIDGQQSNRKIRWSANYGGLFALEQLLAENPPSKAGDKLSMPVLAPLVYELGRLEVEAMGSALVSFSDGSSEMLLELEVRSTLGEGEPMTSYVWVDKLGAIRKRFVPNANLFIERTDEATATKLPSTAVAQGPNPETPETPTLQETYHWTAISLDRPIERPLETSAVGFSITPREPLADLGAILEGIPNQYVQRKADGSIQLAVDRSRRSALNAMVPSDGDLAPNSWIQSDAPVIKVLAATLPEGSPSEKLERLIEITRIQLPLLDDSERFRTTVDAITNGRGDSTEHAVVLAALCRAAKIPARVVAGLAYQETDLGPQLQYRMWTLAYIDDQWIHVDSLLGKSPAPAERFGLISDDLSNPEIDIVTVQPAQMMRNLQVRVAGAKYFESTEE